MLSRFKSKPLAVAGKLEDVTVVNESVDFRCRGNRIEEDVGPIREREVCGDSDAAASRSNGMQPNSSTVRRRNDRTIWVFRRVDLHALLRSSS